MTDYAELVKALRETATFTKFNDLLSKREQKLENLAFDAADAIEALEHELNVQKNMLENLLMSSTELLIPKHGEWVEDTTTYAGPGLTNYKCSLCGKICGTWRRGLKPSELPNWCGNCGADMRAKMEVQDESVF